MTFKYADARISVLDEQARAHLQGKGIKDPAKIAALQTALRNALMPHLEGHHQVNTTQARQMGAAVLRRLVAVADGKVTPESMQRERDATYKLVRARYRSDAATNEALAETNQHMRENEPKAHAALDPAKTPELAGIGNSPIVVLPLLAETQDRKAAAEHAKYRGSWLKDERSRQAATVIPPHGILGGKDV